MMLINAELRLLKLYILYIVFCVVGFAPFYNNMGKNAQDALPTEAVDMNGRFQMQGGKNWFLPKEMNANRFFWDSHWLEIWSNHFYPSMGPNGGSVAMDSGVVFGDTLGYAA
jgi:hypothetical protein